VITAGFFVNKRYEKTENASIAPEPSGNSGTTVYSSDSTVSE